MPNYCWNHVTITGNKKELDKIYRKFDKYQDCNYFTAFGDFILDKGKIDDDLEAIKARYGDEKAMKYVYDHNVADVVILEKLHRKLEEHAPPLVRPL